MALPNIPIFPPPMALPKILIFPPTDKMVETTKRLPFEQGSKYTTKNFGYCFSKDQQTYVQYILPQKFTIILFNFSEPVCIKNKAEKKLFEIGVLEESPTALPTCQKAVQEKSEIKKRALAVKPRPTSLLTPKGNKELLSEIGRFYAMPQMVSPIKSPKTFPIRQVGKKYKRSPVEDYLRTCTRPEGTNHYTIIPAKKIARITTDHSIRVLLDFSIDF
jgi:hypothetical protein